MIDHTPEESPSNNRLVSKPLVAIVGRPNVGKSTLFNRLVGRREAVVTDIPGTTRDRIIGDVDWDGSVFTLVDTGGLEPPIDDPMKEQVQAQVETAIEDADLLIFLMDVVDGLSPIDEEISRRLRRLKKPLIMAVNKVDNLQRELAAAEFHRLGFGELLLISAYHNLGMYDLMERTVSLLPTWETEEPEVGVPRIAILGRTNVGKSMLLNAILGEERAIVSPVAGTTRDALDTRFTFNGHPMVLVDTAGIRRRGQVRQGIERYSVLRAIRALNRSDITFLVMDAMELATAQDAHVFGFAVDGFKGLVAVVNKWDLTDRGDTLAEERAHHTVRRRFHFMPYVPVAFTSALTGKGVEDLLNLTLEIYNERHTLVSPSQLTRVVNLALAEHPPVATDHKPVNIKGARQVDINPPCFLFNTSNPRIHFSYRRYLENRLREAFKFKHTHLRLVFKRTS
jgi:GTP-binding protein